MRLSILKRHAELLLGWKGASESNSVVWKLLQTLVPALVVLLGITGFLTYRFSSEFITTAVQRTVQLHNLAQVAALEMYLEHCREDALRLARYLPNECSLRDFLAFSAQSSGQHYPFVGYISLQDSAHLFLTCDAGKIQRLQLSQEQALMPDPLSFFQSIRGLSAQSIWISEVQKAAYPFPTGENANHRLRFVALHMGAPVYVEGRMRGYVVLGVPVQALRDILSTYNSESSPLRAYSRSPEERFSFFFTPEGWVLFQSEEHAHLDKTLRVEGVQRLCDGRSGFSASDTAFLPAGSCKPFWQAVGKVAEGKHGLLGGFGQVSEGLFSTHAALAYAPVRVQTVPGQPKKILGGVAFEDRSRLLRVAGYKHVDVMFLITLASAVLGSVLICVLSWIVARPLLRLARDVYRRRDSGDFENIAVGKASYEVMVLQDAINNLLARVRWQMHALRAHDLRLEQQELRQPVETFSGQILDGAKDGSLAKICGLAPCMQKLRSEITKAAHVDVDVLIVGETGTGKQLAAEGVHFSGQRKSAPFISINCGELDENLLLDTLFGHVKGAYTEARHERKGAFLEAHQGTLFLDEIQNASPRVQQALLRALALRAIKPLGSDQEIAVDVRVITASNVDLRDLVERGLFREDLYFRLKVVLLETPALRDHPEDILILSAVFLREAESLVGQKELVLSKGALQCLQEYHWPGNVRELRNVLMRVAVMCEGPLLHAEDLGLDPQVVKNFDANLPNLSSTAKSFFSFQEKRYVSLNEQNSGTSLGAEQEGDIFQKESNEPSAELTERQQLLWVEVCARGSISRSEYQALLEQDVSARTAVYDLQALVKKGLVQKEGSGPATRYVCATK